jgi:hypothetical protein
LLKPLSIFLLKNQQFQSVAPWIIFLLIIEDNGMNNSNNTNYQMASCTSTRNHSQEINSAIALLLLLVLALLPARFAQAAVVTFSDFTHLGSDDVDYIVTIEDDAEVGVAANHFKISYQVAPPNILTTAKFTGFFFDANDAYTSANLGLSNETVASCGLGFDTHHITGGCGSNLNLGTQAGAFQGYDWDVGITWKNSNDLSNGQVQSFKIAALNLSINDFSNIGLRGQDTNGGGGSAKEFQSTPNAVPVPASAWLFFSSTVALLVIRKKHH